MAKDKLRSEVSESKPRDEKGHFIKVPDYKTAKNPVEKFLLSHTGNYKDQEDLLDIRIGNPLGKIIDLLEQIKKQKAFSFTLKGSLGIAGVVLVISVFGIFGGGRLICDKGVQSEVGVIKILNAREIYSKQIPLLTYVLDLLAPSQKLIKNRTILLGNDEKTIYLPYSEEVDLKQYANSRVIATGNFNSCSRTLIIDDSSAVEVY